MARWSWTHLNRQRQRRVGQAAPDSIRPLQIALALLLVVVVMGTMGYTLIEGWSAWDGFWMVLITLTSIGYGEVHPLSDAGRAWTVLIIVGGLSLGTYALTRVTSALVEGDLLADYRRRRRRRIVAELKGHYIIVGAGRLGAAVLAEVRGAALPVCVIERDPEVAAELEHQGVPVIMGDGANDETLREAGIERAAGLAVAVPSGAEAIFVTLSARHLSPTLPIATRAADQEASIKARRAGATSVVSPFHMGGWRMAHGLIRPSASNFLDLATLSAHEDILIEELDVHEGAQSLGKTLRELNVRVLYDLLVIAILREDGEMVPTPEANAELYVGDVVIVVGHPDGVRRFAETL